MRDRLTMSGFPSFLSIGVLLAGAMLGTRSYAQVPVDLTGYVMGRAVFATSNSPRQTPELTLGVSMDAYPAAWLRTYVELRGAVGGPYRDPDSGVFRTDEAFQALSPSLSIVEGFVEASARELSLAVGLRRFTWGRLDGIPPLDVLNPRSLHDPIVETFEHSKIGIPAVELSYHPEEVPIRSLSQLGASVFYVPEATVPRLPIVEERWFPPTTSFGRVLIGIGVLEGVEIPLRFLQREASPPRRFDEKGFGFRLSGTWRNADLDAYHYTGPLTQANVALDAEVGFAEAGGLEARVMLRPDYDRVRMTGLSSSISWGPVSLRGEVAYFRGQAYRRSGRALLRETLAGLTNSDVLDILIRVITDGRASVEVPELTVKRDSVEWGVGADTFVGSTFVLFQVNQVVLTESAPELLIEQPSTRITGQVRRAFLDESLTLELRGIYSLEQGSWILFPRVSYRLWEDLEVRISYLAVNGPVSSRLGQFRRNDEFVLELEYRF